MGIITAKKDIKKIGVVFLITGLVLLPVAFIALISGSYNIKNSFDVFMDTWGRFFFASLPVVVLISATGLLMYKKWGRLSAIMAGTILSIIFLVYGILAIIENKIEDINFT